MWPIQFAFRLRISCRIFLYSLILSNTSSFLTWSVQLIFSILLQHHISFILSLLFIIYWWNNLRINTASNWFFITQIYWDALSTKHKMLINVDELHKIGAQKAVVFLWVLMKLLLILFRGKVRYFASKEGFGHSLYIFSRRTRFKFFSIPSIKSSFVFLLRHI